MTTPRRPGRFLPATLLGVVLIAGGCRGDDARPARPAADEPTPAVRVAKGPATQVTLGEVTGRLPARHRARVRTEVLGVVDHWFDAAYVGGDYPRKDFQHAFPGFSRGARAEARADLALMSNAAIGERLETVRATRRQLVVDVLAVRGRAVGVTARFRLGFETTGRARRAELVRGRLFLSRERGSWRVFGYDVTRGSDR